MKGRSFNIIDVFNMACVHESARASESSHWTAKMASRIFFPMDNAPWGSRVRESEVCAWSHNPKGGFSRPVSSRNAQWDQTATLCGFLIFVLWTFSLTLQVVRLWSASRVHNIQRRAHILIVPFVLKSIDTTPTACACAWTQSDYTSRNEMSVIVIRFRDKNVLVDGILGLQVGSFMM